MRIEKDFTGNEPFGLALKITIRDLPRSKKGRGTHKQMIQGYKSLGGKKTDL